MKIPTGPPAAWRSALRRVLPTGPAGADVLTELDEEFADRAAVDRTAADVWYRYQARQVVLRYALPYRLRRSQQRFSGGLYTCLLLLPEDARAAIRSVRSSATFSAVATLVLGVGIGLSTAAFSILDTVLLRELPFADPERTVQIWDNFPGSDRIAGSVSEPNLNDYRSSVSAIERWAAIAPGASVYLTDGGPEQVRAVAVTGDVFSLAPVAPVLGRVLGPADDMITDGAPVMIGHALWQERFGGDIDVAGRALPLRVWRHQEGWQPWAARIVGVLPPDYRLPPFQGQSRLVADLQPDLIVNFASANWGWGNRGMWHYRVLGTLTPGVTLEQARQQLAAVADGIAEQFPATNDGYDATIVPMGHTIDRLYERPLTMLMVASLLVLFIGCANVAGLLFARGTARGPELAVRAALGAGRLRLCRQLVLESLVLGGLGSAFGLLVARWLIDAVRLRGQGLFRLDQLGLDPRAAIFAIATGGLAVIVFGLPPAWRSLAAVGRTHLRSGASRPQESLRALRVLVTTQVAIAFALLAGAGLLLTSFGNLINVETGIETASVLRADWTNPAGPFSKRTTQLERMDLIEDIVRRVESLPEISHAAAASAPALAGTNVVDITIPRADGSVSHFTGDWRQVSPGYFVTMGIRLLAGREPTRDDYDAYRRQGALGNQMREWNWESSEPSHLLPAFWEVLPIWISASMADAYWPGANPVGQVLHWGRQPAEAIAGIGNAFETPGQDNRYPSPSPLRVVGVVAYARSADLAAAPTPQFYTMRIWGARSVVARVDGVPTPGTYDRLLGAIESADPQEVSVVRVESMTDALANAASPSRLVAELSTALGVLAALLTGTGLLGVLAYTVGQRQHEFGIRISLGAHGADVMRLVLGDAIRLIGTGVVVGVAIALAGGRYVASLLYEVSPGEPAILIVTALVVVMFGTAASVLPVLRARRVDPMLVLRQD